MESVPEYSESRQRTSGAEDSQSPKVGVVLVNWNGAEFTIPCIESLLRSNYSNFQIIVVNNGSMDGSPERIAQEYPQVELLRQPSNSGLPKARNQGIEHALKLGSDYAITLDNDTRAGPSSSWAGRPPWISGSS